ncbi:MAG: GlsB/YeaQ/YmgE family stress response membrane protein [Pikeienuella sp.]
MGPILLLALVGVAAGFIATKVMRIEMSLVETIAIGVLGAIVGGVILRVLIAASSAAFGLVGAVIGACLLIWLYRRYLRK